MTSKQSVRAAVYAALADALADPPPWLSGPGTEWPLFEAAVQAAQNGYAPALEPALQAVAAIKPESFPARRRRYRQMFAGPGRPNVWLYESMYVDGRLLGPSTLAVQQVYRAAGLEPEGAELPDHASLELTFLSWLARQAAGNPAQAAEWRQLSRKFVKRHVARWLPDMGRALAATGDAVYGPIGQLLSVWLKEAMRPPRRQTKTGLTLPAVTLPENCTLCGFCVQVCPTQALLIRETETETGLVLNPATCISCGKCERICSFNALHMQQPPTNAKQPTALHISARSVCPGCGQPTVSRAELDAIAHQLGQRPTWLDYCLTCRPTLMERN